MNNASRIRIMCFTICLALFTSVFIVAAESTVVTNPIDEVDQLIEMVQDSPKDCWRRPAGLRKHVIIKKLSVVRDLIEEEDYADAYDKMLHDIKPKLTGLKTDENEEPWSRCRWNKLWPWLAWVKCVDLREEFRLKCNSILTLLKEGPVPVDDTTPPTISIDYVGEYYIGEPGVWNVYAEDLESGLSAIQILVDGVQVLRVDGLAGTMSATYEIPVPDILGIHTIEVYATNYDPDGKFDQETGYLSHLTEIIPDPTDPGDIPIVIG